MDRKQLNYFLERYPFRAMADADGKPTGQIVTCPVRVAFPQLDKLYPNKKYPARQPESSAVLIVPSEADISGLKAECQRVAVAHFGDALKTKMVELQGFDEPQPLAKALIWPWRSQKTNAGKPGYSADGSGIWFRAGSSIAPPRVIDRDKQPLDAGNSDHVYGGMWAIALLQVYAYPKDTGKLDGMKCGVGLGLRQLQKIADGEVLAGGGGNYDDAFGKIEAGSMPSKAGTSAAVPDAEGIHWG